MELKTLAEYHEDSGPVVFYCACISAPPVVYVGTPLDQEWPFQDDWESAILWHSIPAEIEALSAA